MRNIDARASMKAINLEDSINSALLKFDSHFRPQAPGRKRRASSCKRKATSRNESYKY